MRRADHLHRLPRRSWMWMVRLQGQMRGRRRKWAFHSINMPSAEWLQGCTAYLGTCFCSNEMRGHACSALESTLGQLARSDVQKSGAHGQDGCSGCRCCCIGCRGCTSSANGHVSSLQCPRSSNSAAAESGDDATDVANGWFPRFTSILQHAWLSGSDLVSSDSTTSGASYNVAARDH